MKLTFPFPSFPNSWFFVAFSDELHLEDVKPLHYFGKELVLFRTKEGTPHVFDAHCPHLGAHLGYGGKLKGETIQCPFHGWCFDSNGQCVKIPYTSKIPSKARTRSWFVREVNGLILVYYHAQGEPPTWEIPEIPEFKSEEWTPFCLVHQWKIRSRVPEIHENVADIVHFPMVHATPFIKIETLSADNQTLSLFFSRFDEPWVDGTSGAELETKFDITLYGLGFSIEYFGQRFTKSDCKFITVNLLTPVDEEHTEINTILSIKKLPSEAANSEFLANTCEVFKSEQDRDFAILEKRAYPTNPLLCEGEESLTQYWDWASQFFSEEPTTTRNTHIATVKYPCKSQF